MHSHFQELILVAVWSCLFPRRRTGARREMPGKRLLLVAARHRHVTAGMQFSPNDAPSLELHGDCEGSVSSGAGEPPTLHPLYGMHDNLHKEMGGECARSKPKGF